MNIQQRYSFTVATKHDAHIEFSAPNTDIKAHVFVLEPKIIRVLFEKESGLELERTWSIAPGLNDLPYKGRERKSTEHFSCPRYDFRETEDDYVVETEMVKATIKKKAFALLGTGVTKTSGLVLLKTETHKHIISKASSGQGSSII